MPLRISSSPDVAVIGNMTPWWTCSFTRLGLHALVLKTHICLLTLPCSEALYCSSIWKRLCFSSCLFKTTPPPPPTQTQPPPVCSSPKHPPHTPPSTKKENTTLEKKKKKKKSHYVVKLAITNMQNQLDFEIKVAIDYCLHIVLGKSPMNEPPDQAFFSFTSIWCGLFDSLVSICMHPHTHVYGSFKSMFCHSGNNTSSLFILNVYITFFFFFFF